VVEEILVTLESAKREMKLLTVRHERVESRLPTRAQTSAAKIWQERKPLKLGVHGMSLDKTPTMRADPARDEVSKEYRPRRNA
jgi:hypothetical protein